MLSLSKHLYCTVYHNEAVEMLRQAQHDRLFTNWPHTLAIITIMVLEIKVPHGGTDWVALLPLVPVFLSYVLSFVYVGIYWKNHHLMLGSANRISGSVL